MAMLEVRDLHVAFPRGKRDEVEALRGVDLTLEKGERLGVVGESGAGKSMLAFAILNLIAEPGRVSGGTIRFHGDNLLELSERKIRKLRGNRISMIFQDPMVTLNPVMTIGAQMIETLQAHRRISKSEAHKLCVEKLRMVAIPSAENRMTSYPHELSGGLRQRVAIAQAVIHAPRVIGLVSSGPEVIVMTAPVVITPPCRRSVTGWRVNCMVTGPPIFPTGTSPYHLRKRPER